MSSIDALRHLLEVAAQRELRPAEAEQLVDALSTPADPETLRSLHARYLERDRFAVGDIVRWKAGLRNKQLPEYETPAVVVEVLDEPIVDSLHGPETPYFRERLDIALGVLDPEDDLVVFHYDSARFERFPSGRD